MAKPNLIFLLLSIALSIANYVGHAQVIGGKGDYVWEMGWLAKSKIPKENFFEIDFKTEPLTAKFVDRKLQMESTSASYCDEEGRLLMYSNGVHIADSTYQIMENGDSVSFNNFFTFWDMEAGYPSSRNNIFLPISENEIVYLQQLVVFLPDSIVPFKDLVCADISFKENALGKVLKKNQIIASGNFDGLSMNACRHANGNDWWILLQTERTGNFFVYLLNPSGLHLKNEYNFTVPKFPSTGSSLIFSPNGEQVVKIANINSFFLFDFDRQKGVLSNLRIINADFPLSSGLADCAFASNSRFLYTFNTGFILQFDLIDPDVKAINASRDTIAKFDAVNYPSIGFFAGNLAPDGKIYIGSDVNNTLSVINYPNRNGKACGFEYVGITLPAYYASGGLPNFPHYRLGPIDGSEADTLDIDNLVKAKFRIDNDSSFYNRREFIDLSYFEPKNWSWDFGDGQTSSEVSPVHWFPSIGTYKVCLTVSNDNGSDTYCRDVNIGPLSAGNLLKDYGLSLNPNPCRDYIFLNIKEKFPKALQMKITDAQGIIVQQSPIDLNNGFTTVDVKDLKAGSYFMTLLDSAGGQEVLQFVKL